jgi:hypothetical protein
LAKEGNNFLLFLQNFVYGRKRGRHTSGSDMKIYELNLGKKIGYFNSSWKNTQFQKTISRNRVLEVKL